MTCPDGWTPFIKPYEASCLKLESTPLLFDEAFKFCHDKKARLLSFAHRMDKVYFINDLIVKSGQHDTINTTLWFFDPTFMNRKLQHTKGSGKAQKTDDTKEDMPKPQYWMVISPNEDPAKIELLANDTAVARNFICEAPAHPAAQRPQFEMEPEHVLIADFLVNPPAAAPKETRPFIVTFNCLAYGLPKPTVEWRLLHKAQNQSLISEPIEAKTITDPHEPLKEPSMTSTTFFNLQRDCKAHPCPPETIQERSQLVVVNPQFMNLTKNVVCVAKNAFGSVISREAEFFVTKLSEFATKEDKVTVKAGISAIVHNTITAEPDTAAAECFRVNKPKDAPPQFIPIEHLNQMLQGAIQMSKATFDFIIDSARPEDAGDYICRARMHNGRLGHVMHEKTISVTVEPCEKDKGCDLQAKPVTVIEGYPAVLSMNPLSNRIIRSGDDFLLECPCSGKRRPDEQLMVHWNLNNRTDLPVTEIPVLPRGSALLLHNARNELHTGAYYCQCVRGQEKSDWRSISIQVLPKLEPVNRKEILTFKAGQKATFGCRVDADLEGLGVFVEPLRDDQTLAGFLASADKTDKRIEVMRGGPSHYTINIADIKEADAGIYGCRVTVNFFGKWVSHDTFYTTVFVEK